MTEIKDGGMSLRDWFAGMALQGLLSVSDEELLWNKEECSSIALDAYDLADAMLAQRNKLGC